MAVIAQIIPAEYWLVFLPAAAVIAWLTCIVTKQVKSKRASSHETPLLRLYETRLQTAGAGNADEVKRLINDELQRRPHITQIEAARRAYNRFKGARRNAWNQHNAH